jgi:hypothetical protein
MGSTDAPPGPAVLRIVVAAACVVLLIGGSLLSQQWKEILLIHGPLHLPVHYAAFGAVGVLTLLNAHGRRNCILLSLALIELAFVVEAIQQSLSGVNFEWRDFLTDAFGVASALLISLRRNGHTLTHGGTRK